LAKGTLKIAEKCGVAIVICRVEIRKGSSCGAAEESKRELSLTLDKGQSRYVRLDISLVFFAGHVYPVLVENSVGENEITSCSYTGSPK
jgi:hypothetical protein